MFKVVYTRKVGTLSDPRTYTVGTYATIHGVQTAVGIHRSRMADVGLDPNTFIYSISL